MARALSALGQPNQPSRLSPVSSSCEGGVQVPVQSRNLLAALGCNEGQGYFLAKPMPADGFIAWVQNWTEPKQLEDSGESLLGWLG
jgi:predicted signal transduction protein with EAL and GGDEF domain